MEFLKRKRYCYVLRTGFADVPKISEPCKAHSEVIESVSWEKKWENASTDGIEMLGDDIHAVLDDLPQNAPYDCLLDVLWFTDAVPKDRKIPSNLFGALKRAVEWHGAAIHVVTAERRQDLNKFNYLKELKAELIFDISDLQEYLRSKLFWRGVIAFFDDSSMSFVHTNTAYELRDDSVKSDSDFEKLAATNAQLSQRLKVVTKCSMSTIPAYFFTKTRFVLRTWLQSNKEECSSDDLFADEELFGSGNCLIAKLERYESKNDAMSFHMKKSKHRTTDTWREAVRNGAYTLDLDNDLMGKTLLSTYFVIYSDKKLGGNMKRCIMLDSNAPLAGQAKSNEVVTDTRLASAITSDVPIDSKGPTVTIMNGDFPDLHDLQVSTGSPCNSRIIGGKGNPRVSKPRVTSNL